MTIHILCTARRGVRGYYDRVDDRVGDIMTIHIL